MYNSMYLLFSVIVVTCILCMWLYRVDHFLLVLETATMEAAIPALPVVSLPTSSSP
jgi:hypothetical protein